MLKERDDLSETCADLKQQMAQVKESSLLTMALYKQYAAAYYLELVEFILQILPLHCCLTVLLNLAGIK